MEGSIEDFEGWFIYEMSDATLISNLRGKLALKDTLDTSTSILNMTIDSR